jgi:hypothetical protein
MSQNRGVEDCTTAISVALRGQSDCDIGRAIYARLRSTHFCPNGIARVILSCTETPC